MPELRCNVHTCAHNQNQYCTLDAIEVAGSSAKIAKDTSCSSFMEKKGGYQNYMKEATPTSDVSCQAKECQYNFDCKCHAGKISVGGNEACSCNETLCATFQEKK